MEIYCHAVNDWIPEMASYSSDQFIQSKLQWNPTKIIFSMLDFSQNRISILQLSFYRIYQRINTINKLNTRLIRAIKNVTPKRSVLLVTITNWYVRIYILYAFSKNLNLAFTLLTAVLQIHHKKRPLLTRYDNKKQWMNENFNWSKSLTHLKCPSAGSAMILFKRILTRLAKKSSKFDLLFASS